MSDWARHITALRVVALALALGFGAISDRAQAQTARAEAVAESIWRVTPSWGGPFFWVFWDNGRYQDTDGPVGSFTQSSDTLTLNSDDGWTYRGTISGDTMSGVVFETASGVTGGTFTATRVRPDE